ncbi:stress response protein SCP2 [Clostridium saccharobutylicum]|uniref:TerD family protein n=1 Tax=Clostridium saccharobutylicum TaxID=169679 RepID=UPI000983F3DA|nr:TerD family protein [Clostridium saccharobutylicum]AQS08574.1 stress response protein SCP2 [Clostridium saccharobutylicum]MBC2436046.1 TerD family protein [Clostridium saccharobutylicum]NSB87820.1 stress response protein SCP2 [Clostridium saccharobutylicum]NYC29086.1 stress response protein SCP2 [Clostridium saccharobutylicum]OOM13277.1 stress response protein SCP2 [Clostridium saccharobutylicum]
MSINLVKGQKIDLTKNNNTLKKLIVGLGWDPVKQEKKGFFNLGSSKPDVDVDASVLMLRNNRFIIKEDLIYFGNLKSKCGGVIHAGDNLTGDGHGDDEQILVDLSKIPHDVNKLIFVTNIYQCIERKQSFGMIENAFIRIADYNNNQNIAMFNLTEDYNGKTALIIGEVYRHNNEWKFAAIGEGTQDTCLGDMAEKYC